MDKQNFNEKALDLLIAAACEEILEEEMAALPDDADINHTFSPEFEKKMRRLFAQYNRKQLFRKTVRIFSRAAAVITVLVVTGWLLIANVSALRRPALNIMMEMGEKFLQINFAERNRTVIENEGIKDAIYIPEGYVFDEEIPTVGGFYIIYRSSDNLRIIFTKQIINESLTSIYDNEHAVPIEIDVNGTTVTILDGTPVNNSCIMFWVMGDYLYDLISDELSSEKMMETLESIIAFEK